jgi:hypothetical protein
MLKKVKSKWFDPLDMYLVDLKTIKHLPFMNMYHWKFDKSILESMNYVYTIDVGLLVYSQCVLWELSKPIFFGCSIKLVSRCC